MVGVNWDITSEFDNIRSIERFRLAVEAAYDHIIICDVEGKIVYANDAAVRTTGYPKFEMLGKTPSLWGGQMPPEFYKTMWHTISVLKKPFVGEVSNIRKSGEPYIAEAHISPILDQSGKKVEFYLGVERDITLLKEIDKSKTEFVSLASHQLRTPLSAVNWYAELLLDEHTGKLNADQKSYVDEIYAGNQRMVSLVNSLLNISRLELGTFEITPKSIDPADVVSDVLKELEPKIKQNHLSVINNSPEGTVKYSADAELLHIVIQNLLSNAVKYTPSKGSITVTVGFMNDAFKIIVADTGRGIPAHQKNKIFTKLFRADNVRELDIEGTGLGLYIVKSIVEQSGGSISFTSQINKGTTFTITLPKQGMLKKQGITGLEHK
jgi:PAS domain S-box-containing protein